MAESLLNTPLLWINAYLKEKISQDIFGANNAVPFFPTSPSTIEDITRTFQTNSSGLMAVYDRMFKMRRGAFPHIRYEQALYYFYASEQDAELTMIKLQEEMLRLMDRGDESAEDMNKWAAGKTLTVEGEELKNKFYFHEFKIYQLEESRDIIDFGTAQTFAGNKIIIDYCYHQMTPKYQLEDDGSYSNIKDINNADIDGTRVILEDGPLDDGFRNPPV